MSDELELADRVSFTCHSSLLHPMKTTISNLLLGKNNVISGLIALALVATIALGCTCGKNFDLANIAKNAEKGSTNTSSDDSEADSDLPEKDLLDALVAETTANF